MGGLIGRGLGWGIKRNPKKTPGFLRIDSITKLKGLLIKILTTEWKYVGAIVEPINVGALIKSLDLS